MTPDQINGLFEAVGAVLIARNCVQLHKDKMVRGVTLAPVVFWTAWGLWNLYFYPTLGAWWSFYGGIAVVFANATWVGMAIHYNRAEHRAKFPHLYVVRDNGRPSSPTGMGE